MAGIGVTERLLRRDRTVLILMIGVLVVLAGLYTLFGVGMNMTALEMTAMREMRDMPGMTVPGNWMAVHAALVFLMWWVMMVAMMLPSVSPTVLLYSALLRNLQQPVSVPLVATSFLAGYLAIWAAFSAFAAATQWVLEGTGYVSATMMTLLHTVPSAIVLIATGLFQFTPMKEACLQHCRSPAQFIAQRKRPGAAGAFVMGCEHGLYCLGCCWFLMAFLFVGGIMNLYWIVGLAVLVAIEKLTILGQVFARAVGVILVGWGTYILLALM